MEQSPRGLNQTGTSHLAWAATAAVRHYRECTDNLKREMIFEHWRAHIPTDAVDRVDELF